MARTCPSCRVAMQPLFLEREGAPDVQLDRCAGCGAVWFDAGEAELVARRQLSWAGREGTGRPCPGCGGTLEAGEVRALVPAARCRGCHGVWLEEAALSGLGNGQLERLAARAVRREVQPPEARPTVGFACAQCGERAPWSEANGTARGLVCRRCTPKAVDDPSHGATVLTKTDRFVSQLLVSVEGDTGSRRSVTPLLAELLDWFLD